MTTSETSQHMTTSVHSQHMQHVTGVASGSPPLMPVRPVPAPQMIMPSPVVAIIPRSLDEVLEVARMVLVAGLAPESYKGKNDDETRSRVVIGIMKGAEVGFPPITALATIYIINNRPSLYGDAAMSLAQARGLFLKHEEIWQGKEVVGKEPIPNDFTDEITCIFRVWRRGIENPFEGKFSVRDAKRAGLWGRRQPWIMYPKRMLLARAKAYAMREAFPDALMGLAIVEEMEDLTEQQPTKLSPSVLDDSKFIEHEPAGETAAPPPSEIAVPVKVIEGLQDALAHATGEPSGVVVHRPSPEGPRDALPVPTDDGALEERAQWSTWGTKEIQRILKCDSLPALEKIEGRIKMHDKDYAAVVGNEKAQALLDLVAARRAELAK